jgi:hypothetical protein
MVVGEKKTDGRCSSSNICETRGPFKINVFAWIFEGGKSVAAVINVICLQAADILGALIHCQTAFICFLNALCSHQRFG